MKEDGWKVVFYKNSEGKEPAKERLNSLRDRFGLAKILTRIKRAELGNFGDHKSIGEGVYELRITFGPGYRVYYGIDGRDALIILLLAGDKANQFRDIQKAKIYWRDYKGREQS